MKQLLLIGALLVHTLYSIAQDQEIKGSLFMGTQMLIRKQIW